MSRVLLGRAHVTTKKCRKYVRPLCTRGARAAAPMSSPAAPPDEFTPVVPANNTLTYKGLVLENGLTVLLVHSHEREKGSAALSLARGHLSDPWDCPGTAHFVEHMLFLGTEKYPEEGDYKKYLKNHGGECNAMTTPDMTLYYFSVVSDYFEGAVDRFLQFFISPTFTESSTDRELNAIESEFQKNLLFDPKRMYYLLKHCANPEHVFAKFGSGNLKSLKHDPAQRGIDSRERLLGFYNEHYSANLMSLVLRSDRPIAEMERWVRDGFSRIANRNTDATRTKRIAWPSAPFLPAQLSRAVHFKPLGRRQELVVYFPFSTVAPTERGNQSKGLLCHLLGHEGRGSLCLALRKRGWITDLISSRSVRDNYGYASVKFVLTAQGRAQPFSVLGELFGYVRAVQGQHAEASRVWGEQRKCHQINFDNAPKWASRSCATMCAENLRYADSPEECVSRSHGLWGEFDPEDFYGALDDIHAGNMLVFLTDPDPGATAALRKEPWWGVEHSVREFTEDEAAAMRVSTGTYTMPPGNPYIPDTFAVHPPAPTPLPHPAVVLDGRGVTAWWKQDDMFNTPKLILSAYLTATCVQSSAKGQRALVLFARLLNMQLSEAYYDANTTTHPWSVSAQLGTNAVLVQINGFADKLDELFLNMLRDILQQGIRHTDFESVHQQMLREVATRQATRKSDELAARALSESLLHNFIPLAQSDAALAALTYEDMVAFVDDFKASLTVSMFLHGNVTRSQACTTSTAVADLLAADGCGTRVGPPYARRVVSLADVPPTTEHRVVSHLPNPQNTESCVMLHYQVGCVTNALRARCRVLQQLLAPRYFTELRTKQQLGYSVSSVSRLETTELSFRFNVRSGVVPPTEIHARIEAFLHAFGEELEVMEEDVIVQSIESAKRAVLEPSTNLNVEHGKLLQEIHQERYCWELGQLLHAELSKLTKQDIVDVYRTYICPVSSTDGDTGSNKSPVQRRVVAAYNYCDKHIHEMAAVAAATRRVATDELEYAVTQILADDPGQFQLSMPLLPAKEDICVPPPQ